MSVLPDRARPWMPTRRDALAGLTIAPLLWSSARPAWADLRIDITRGKIEPMPIAIVLFQGAGEQGRVGNDMSSVMGGTYPGAGITIGPAMTFGYIVGRYLAGIA